MGRAAWNQDARFREPVRGFRRLAFDQKFFCPLQNRAVGDTRSLMLPRYSIHDMNHSM